MVHKRYRIPYAKANTIVFKGNEDVLKRFFLKIDGTTQHQDNNNILSAIMVHLDVYIEHAYMYISTHLYIYIYIYIYI